MVATYLLMRYGWMTEDMMEDLSCRGGWGRIMEVGRRSGVENPNPDGTGRGRPGGQDYR